MTHDYYFVLLNILYIENVNAGNHAGKDLFVSQGWDSLLGSSSDFLSLFLSFPFPLIFSFHQAESAILYFCFFLAGR